MDLPTALWHWAVPCDLNFCFFPQPLEMLGGTMGLGKGHFSSFCWLLLWASSQPCLHQQHLRCITSFAVPQPRTSSPACRHFLSDIWVSALRGLSSGFLSFNNFNFLLYFLIPRVAADFWSCYLYDTLETLLALANNFVPRQSFVQITGVVSILDETPTDRYQPL
jgi:hypothetical protein